jgi:hypothetical protein
MLKRNYILIAASFGVLSTLTGELAFSNDRGVPYSPNETGEYVAPERIVPVPPLGRNDVPSELREVPSVRGTPQIPMLYPSSPNESGEYVFPRAPW